MRETTMHFHFMSSIFPTPTVHLPFLYHSSPDSSFLSHSLLPSLFNLFPCRTHYLCPLITFIFTSRPQLCFLYLTSLLSPSLSPLFHFTLSLPSYRGSPSSFTTASFIIYPLPPYLPSPLLLLNNFLTILAIFPSSLQSFFIPSLSITLYHYLRVSL